MFLSSTRQAGRQMSSTRGTRRPSAVADQPRQPVDDPMSPRSVFSDAAARSHDPLAQRLSGADDRVRLNEWLPPQTGVVPRIRIGRRWINVLWALPLLFVVIVAAVAAAHALREAATVQEFLLRYPG